MAIQTSVETRDGYLFVRAEGPYALSEVKAALLCTERQVTPERFLGNVAVNRGARVRVATDLNDALRWLECG